MAEYVPLFKPGQAVTRRTSAAVTGGQLVAVSGNGTVAPAGATSAAWLGVAATDAASGADVTIHRGGVQRIAAAGAVTAGDMLASAAGGKVATAATPGAGQQVGVALTTAADGALVEVAMAR